MTRFLPDNHIRLPGLLQSTAECFQQSGSRNRTHLYDNHGSHLTGSWRDIETLFSSSLVSSMTSYLMESWQPAHNEVIAAYGNSGRLQLSYS